MVDTSGPPYGVSGRWSSTPPTLSIFGMSLIGERNTLKTSSISPSCLLIRKCSLGTWGQDLQSLRSLRWLKNFLFATSRGFMRFALLWGCVGLRNSVTSCGFWAQFHRMGRLGRWPPCLKGGLQEPLFWLVFVKIFKIICELHLTLQFCATFCRSITLRDIMLVTGKNWGKSSKFYVCMQKK